MAPPSLQTALAASLLLVSTALAQTINSQLVGTWSTKSAQVLTGPGFYNPVNDTFIEPSHTGISYSFTSDGHYEEAYYRAISNPTNPACPEAVLQFQHGTAIQNADGSLLLTPFAVDGRQLLSNPCQGSSGAATYSRYNQSETMQKWQVYTDPYHGVMRLDLYEFDGSPMNPMYLAYSPPIMLPTQTMNPLPASTSAAASGKTKRGIFDNIAGAGLPLNKDGNHITRTDGRAPLDANLIWWVGIGMTVFGGAAYLL